MDFEEIVETHYQTLFRFALSLSKSQDSAGDLTQQTFCVWAQKGHQLRDITQVKTWLFTTLYRDYLGVKRNQVRFPHQEISIVEHELPEATAMIAADQVDAADILKALQSLDDVFREPLTLFYIQDLSYREIAEVLDVPIGTVMSRLARGKCLLRKTLGED